MHLVLKLFIVFRILAVVKLIVQLRFELSGLNLFGSSSGHGASDLVKFLQSLLRDYAKRVLSFFRLRRFFCFICSG